MVMISHPLKRTESELESVKSACGERERSAASRYLLLVFLVLFVPFFGCGGTVSTDAKPVPGGPTGTTPISSEPTGTTPIGSSPTGTAILTWAAPATNVDGSPLTDLTGYRVYYGAAPDSYTSVDIGNVLTYEVGGLTAGQTYFFVVTATNRYGSESDFSNTVSKTIN
jgi:hypothetical protein